MRFPDDTDHLLDDPELRAFVDDVRAYASSPLPVVRPDLAAVFTAGIGAGATRHGPGVARPAPADTAVQRLGNRLQRRRGRLALGASVLSLSFLGTGAVGALPGPAQTAFERTAEVVGIELPDEVVSQDELPAQGEPAPVGPEVQDGPRDGREAPRPVGEGEPDPRPEDDPGAPAPGNPPPVVDQGPGGPDRAEPPGRDLGREAGERAPESVPGPASPPRPGPPDTLPERPQGGAPGAGRGQGAGNQVDQDDIDEIRGDGEEGLGRGAVAPPGRPSQPGHRPS